MKRILISTLLLILGCSSSKLLNGNLTEKDILSHINYVLNDLQEQGFTAVIGKAKESKIYVPAKINKVADSFFIDTGATYTFLNEKHISKYRLRKITKESKDTDIVTFFGNISKYDRAIADEFKLGDSKFSPWPFIISKGDNDPILGTDFLHYTNAVIVCKYSTFLYNINYKKAAFISDSLQKYGYSEIDLSVSNSEDINKISYNLN